MISFIKRSNWLPDLFLLVTISALVYLPTASKMTYQRDDWYFMYDGHIAGPSVFNVMFSIDRPARGTFFDAYFALFGDRPFPYQLNTLIWRILGGAAAIWLFRTLWPRQRLPAFLAGLLTTIYPGFWLWVQGIEYLPHAASLGLEILSIALSVKAVQTTGLIQKIIFWVFAFLTGWCYLSLVEYAIGMEVFRFLCIYIFMLHKLPSTRLVKKILSAVRVWWFSLGIPIGFLVWRIFFFQNQRKATDIGLQLSRLFGAPDLTGPMWLVRLFQSTLNTTIFAWTSPFSIQFFSLRLRDMAFALAIALIAIILFLLFDRFFIQRLNDVQENDANWYNEAIFIGFFGTIFGIFPVIVANRVVTFNAYSHYGLPASLSAVIFTVGVLYLVSSKKAQLLIGSALLASAAIAHFGLGVNAIQEQQAIRNFWWQVVWRAPMIRAGTTIVADYPTVNIGSDTDIIWGPANFIYYPVEKSQIPVQYQLSALTTSSDDILHILLGDTGGPQDYRSHVMTVNYTNILILSQPVDGGCVHAIDGRMPRLSSNESNSIMQIAQHSNIANIVTNVAPPQPDDFLFGTEPVHNWCYYYEKADLAVQEGDFNQAAMMGDEVQKMHLHPVDRSEWIPFLQAYAMTGNQNRVNDMISSISGGGYIKIQACQALIQMEKLGYALSSEMRSIRDTLICKN